MKQTPVAGKSHLHIGDKFRLPLTYIAVGTD